MRDPNWGTVQGRLYQLKIDSGRDRFHIRYESDHTSEPIHFRCQAEITGTPDGQIIFSMEGKRLVTMRLGYAGLQVVRHRQLCDALKVLERMYMAFQPSLHLLIIRRYLSNRLSREMMSGSE